MAKLIGSLLGLPVYWSLLIAINWGMMFPVVAHPPCDKLFNDLHACDSLDKVKDILDRVADKETTMVGGVSVAEILRFSNTKCNLDTLTAQHFIGPESYCIESYLVENQHTIKNWGVLIFVRHYARERQNECEKKLLWRLSRVLARNSSHKKVVEKYYKHFLAYKSKNSKVLEPWTHERFSGCIKLSQELESIIPCSISKHVSVDGDHLNRWYKIMNFCRHNLSIQCQGYESSAKRLIQQDKCQSIENCLSEARESMRTIDQLNMYY